MHFSEVLVKAADLVSRAVCLASQVLAFASRFNVSFIGLDLHLASCKNNATCMISSLSGCYAFIYDSLQDIFEMTGKYSMAASSSLGIIS